MRRAAPVTPLFPRDTRVYRRAKHEFSSPSLSLGSGDPFLRAAGKIQDPLLGLARRKLAGGRGIVVRVHILYMLHIFQPGVFYDAPARGAPSEPGYVENRILPGEK